MPPTIRLQPEERLDAAEDAVALAGLARALCVGVEALLLRHQLDAPARELAGELVHDLGPPEQDLLERLLAEAEAVDVARRDHVGAARLAGHEAHLAEE